MTDMLKEADGIKQLLLQIKHLEDPIQSHALLRQASDELKELKAEVDQKSTAVAHAFWAEKYGLVEDETIILASLRGDEPIRVMFAGFDTTMCRDLDTQYRPWALGRKFKKDGTPSLHVTNLYGHWTAPGEEGQE